MHSGYTGAGGRFQTQFGASAQENGQSKMHVFFIIMITKILANYMPNGVIPVSISQKLTFLTQGLQIFGVHQQKSDK